MGGWSTPGQGTEILMALGRKKGCARVNGPEQRPVFEAVGEIGWTCNTSPKLCSPTSHPGCPLPFRPSGRLLSHLYNRGLDWVKGVEDSDLPELCGGHKHNYMGTHFCGGACACSKGSTCAKWGPKECRHVLVCIPARCGGNVFTPGREPPEGLLGQLSLG